MTVDWFCRDASEETPTFLDRLSHAVDEYKGWPNSFIWIAESRVPIACCSMNRRLLDITYQIEVLFLIRTLSHAKGIDVVIVLHDVNMAARFCDEIPALHSGRLIARGTPAEIVTSEQMRRIYGLDMDVLPHLVSGLPVAVPL